MLERLKRRTLPLTLALALCASGFSMAAPPTRLAEDEKVTLNFVDADIDTVIKALGLFTQKNFVMDGRVKLARSTWFPRALNREEALSTLLSALRLQGISVVEAEGVAKVLLEADAKLFPPVVFSLGTRTNRETIGGEHFPAQLISLVHNNEECRQEESLY